MRGLDSSRDLMRPRYLLCLQPRLSTEKAIETCAPVNFVKGGKKKRTEEQGKPNVYYLI